MAKKLREHAPHFHSTEAEVGKPKLGDVRVEEGPARDPKTGEVLSALFKLPAGDVVRPRAMGADFQLPLDAELVQPEQRAFKVYVFRERPDTGPHGFFANRDTMPNAPDALFDKKGFYRDPLTGERVQMFADRQAWLPEGEHETLEAAHKAAEKHL